MAETKELELPGDWRTFQQAARELGTGYHALRVYIYTHDVPFRKIASVNVVRMSSLVGYQPRGKKLVGIA